MFVTGKSIYGSNTDQGIQPTTHQQGRSQPIINYRNILETDVGWQNQFSKNDDINLSEFAIFTKLPYIAKSIYWKDTTVSNKPHVKMINLLKAKDKRRYKNQK